MSTVTPMAKYKLVFLGVSHPPRRPEPSRHSRVGLPRSHPRHGLFLAQIRHPRPPLVPTRHPPLTWFHPTRRIPPPNTDRIRAWARHPSSPGSCTTSSTTATRRPSASTSCLRRCTWRTAPSGCSCGTPRGRSGSDRSSRATSGTPPSRWWCTTCRVGARSPTRAGGSTRSEPNGEATSSSCSSGTRPI